MTKQDFLERKSFYLKGEFSNTTTYKMGHKASSLEREYRMTNAGFLISLRQQSDLRLI